MARIAELERLRSTCEDASRTKLLNCYGNSKAAVRNELSFGEKLKGVSDRTRNNVVVLYMTGWLSILDFMLYQRTSCNSYNKVYLAILELFV